MNWRLGLLLIVLILFFAAANAWVVGKTDRMQKEVEDYHSQLASRAGDALGNIHLIQSFVRLAVETSEMHRIIGRTLAAQFPVFYGPAGQRSQRRRQLAFVQFRHFPPSYAQTNFQKVQKYFGGDDNFRAADPH